MYRETWWQGEIPVLKDAEVVNFSWHCLRHTFASRPVMAGVDLPTVQELLGHKTIAMTVRYSHLAPKHTLPLWSDRTRLQSAPSDTTTDTGAFERPAAQPIVLQ